MFREIVAIYSNTVTKHIHSVCGKIKYIFFLILNKVINLSLCFKYIFIHQFFFGGAWNILVFRCSRCAAGNRNCVKEQKQLYKHSICECLMQYVCLSRISFGAYERCSITDSSSKNFQH